MHILIIKFIKGFATSIIIFYSKKLVYFIDSYFNNQLESRYVKCPSCQEEFRMTVLKRMDKDRCIFCNTELDFSEKENTHNERRDRIEYRKDQW